MRKRAAMPLGPIATQTERVELVKAYRKDFPLYCKEVFRIKTDYTEGKAAPAGSTQIRPLILDPAQKVIERKIQYRIDRGEPVRLQVLKVRQKGTSTHCVARLDHCLRLNPNKGGIIIGHDIATSDNLFDKVKVAHSFVPEEWMRPMTKKFNRNEIHYGNPDPNGPPGLESRLIISSADNKNAGASFSLHFVLLTEVSRYESVSCDVPHFLQSLLPTVPYQAGTFIIMESTAEEGGQYFQDKWNSKYDNYDKIFLSAISDLTYRIDCTSAQYPTLSRLDSDHYGDEVSLLPVIRDELAIWRPELLLNEDIHHESMRFLLWRRMAINEFCNRDKDAFRRIYPLTPADAFRAGSKGIFNQFVLAEMQMELEKEPPQILRKNFDPHAYDTNTADPLWHESAFYDSDIGPLEIYEEPIPGALYVIGGDPSRGLSDGDPAAAEVLMVTGERPLECCTWNFSIQPDIFGELLYALGCYYNNALIAVEVNGPGIATQRVLQKLYYTNLWYRQKVSDKRYEEISERQGWETDGKNKYTALADLRRAVNFRELRLNSLRTVAQLKDFQELPGTTYRESRLGAAPGKHDDLVLALMIALQMARQVKIPMQRTDMAPKKGSFDWVMAQMSRRRKSPLGLPRQNFGKVERIV